ncbi:MAG TPA: hypothetical protein VFQ00_04465 [Terriglobales bacterium]|nr:hypothetical protein [Terriglobales bacterium]
MKIAIKVFPILLLLAIAPISSFAQAIALAPAQIVENFKPGVPFEYALNVQNKGSEAVDLHVQITDFWYNDKNEKVFTAPGTSPRSAANWIQFVPETFQVPPGTTQQMKAVITPPSDARGGYYAVLFVESTPVATNKQTDDGRRVFTNMRLGCLVLLTAKDTEQYNVTVNDLKLAPPDSTQSLRLTYDIDNESNTHIFTQGHLAILDPEHKLVAKAESGVKRFLPGQKDSMKVDWSGELPPGDYTAVLSQVYGDTRVETRQIAFTIPAKTASK